MSTLTKVFVILTAVLSIAVSILFIGVAAQWDNWRDLARTYQTQAQAEFAHRANIEASTNAALAMKQDALDAATRRIAELEKEKQDLVNDKAKSDAELARARNEAAAATAGGQKLQEVLSVTATQLQGTQTQNQALLAQIMDLQTRNTRLNNRVLELTANVAILTDQTRNLQEKLYAAETGGRISAAPVEQPERVAEVAPHVKGPISAQVTQVDGNYASINAGESSGVVTGMTFIVYRPGGGYVADLVIDRVRPGEAGGKLSSVQGGVRPGDSVIYEPRTAAAGVRP